jgi:hypothetical protein
VLLNAYGTGATPTHDSRNVEPVTGGPLAYDAENVDDARATPRLWNPRNALISFLERIAQRLRNFAASRRRAASTSNTRRRDPPPTKEATSSNTDRKDATISHQDGNNGTKASSSSSSGEATNTTTLSPWKVNYKDVQPPDPFAAHLNKNGTGENGVPPAKDNANEINSKDAELVGDLLMAAKPEKTTLVPDKYAASP